MAWRGWLFLISALAAAGASAFAAKQETPEKGAATLFPTETEAEQKCGSDLVVWIDPATRIYYYRGQDLYGSTKTGGFACRKDAARHGIRPNRTGR